jgi:exopolysaccharide production protein ExoZ
MSGRLDGIQILRFIAAAMVLVQHAVFLPSLNFHLDVMPFRKLFVGGTGLYLFFVISGYVIGRLAEQHPVRFALHRVARIYPPYIAAIIIASIVVTATGGVSDKMIHWRWSYTLLPLGGHVDSWTRIPFWTLIYEMTFYLISFVLLWGGKKTFDIGIIAWTLGIAVCSFLFPAPSDFTANLFSILRSPLSLLFISGACLARMHSGTSWPLATLAVITFSAFWRAGTPYQATPIFAVGALGLINLAVLASPFISKQNWARWPIRFGDYSYGLYLFHFPVIYVVLLTGIERFTTYPIAVAMCLAAGGSFGLLFGYLDHIFYKRLFRPLADKIYERYAYCPPLAAEPTALPGK